MNKTVIAGGIVAAAIIVSITYGAVANPGGDPIKEEPSSEVWNFRFSGQEFHNISSHGFDGISLETGNTYQFKFVPMGDSPEQLRLSLVGISPSVQVFSDTLYLKKTLVDTGISKYYTWEYIGKENLLISNQQCSDQKTCDYEITVERFGNLKGSVSISLSRVSI